MHLSPSWKKWIAILACWTVVTLVYSSHLYVFHNILSDRTTWRFQLAEAAVNFYTWALLTPLVLFMARRFPLINRRWYRSALAHLPASLAVSLLQVMLHTVADLGLIHGHFGAAALWDGFLSLFARTFHFGLLVYWAIVGIHEAIDHTRRQARVASELETRLAQAQLAALKMQLHPHFLFNTLHAISALVHRDPDAADRMIARLSEFLRLSLEAGNLQEVSLKQELEFLDRYLAIEKIRFQDRLTVRMRIDPEALDARVPNLILQPLVENSIRHGFSKRRGAGVIEIEAAQENGTLRLSVRDDGAGLAGSEGDGARGEGIGLSNTRARLEQLYGGDHHFELRERPEGGAEATLSIPFVAANGANDEGEGGGRWIASAR